MSAVRYDRPATGRVLGMFLYCAMLLFRLGMEQNSMNTRPNLLVRLGDAAQGASDLGDIYERALDAVTVGLGTDRASLATLDDSGPMRICASRGLFGGESPRIDAYSPWSAGALDSGAIPAPVLVEDVERDAALGTLGAMLHTEHIAAVAFFPLLRRGRLLGKLTVYFRESRRLGEDDVQWATNVAQVTAQAFSLHRAELEGLRLLEEARQVRQAAESAAQNRNELLALVAHDLRNPINTLQLSLSALLRASSHQDDEKLMRQLQRMGRAASSMAQFIDCLCDVIRIQSGSLQVDLDSEELTSILERSLQALAPRAAERSQTLMVDVPLGIRVRADRDRLTQALTHVVDDAIRSTPTQGWIRLCGRRLSEGRGSMVEIAVADSGPAISAEELPRIFDHPGGGPLHSTRGRRLGLVVAKGIVEAHGGTLLVESSTGAGAVFRLTLPAAE